MWAARSAYGPSLTASTSFSDTGTDVRFLVWNWNFNLTLNWQLFQGGSLLSTVMIPFYWPASLISMGGCIGYAIPGFNGLHPCPP